MSIRHVSVEDGLVIITAGGYDAGIYAIYADNGTEAWNDTDFDGEHLAISNGTVYVEQRDSYDVYLHAFDLQSGEELWSVDYSGQPSGGLAVVGNTVYATGQISKSDDRDYAIYALNASAEGEERWRFEVEGPITGAPTVVNGTVFFGSGDSEYDPKFYALNESDGHIEWIHDLNTQANGAAVADGTVYVSVGNTLRAFDEVSGEEQWNYRLTGSRDHGPSNDPTIAAAPAVADGIVYVTNDEGHAVAVNGSTGDAKWSYRVEGEAQHPAIADGRVYVNAPDSRESDDVVRVYALEEPPFAFSNIAPSATTIAPGEELLVNVTVENVDDEERTYNLSLMGEGVLPEDWRAVARENATLASGDTTMVTFATRINTTGSWNLSVKRNLESEASIGPVTVEVVHPQPNDNWQMAGFDTGWSDSSPNATAPARHLQERWNYTWTAGDEFDDLSEPVVEGDTAYLLHVTEAGSNDYHHLVAHDFESGDVEWEYNLTGDHRIPRGSPTVVDGTVYVFTKSFTGYGDGTPDPAVGTIYAFDATSGDVTWTTNTSLNSTESRLSYDYAPIVANDRVYIGAANNDPDGLNASLIALHASDGSENWTYRVADESEDEKFLPVAVSGDTVIAMLSDEEGVGSYVDSLVAIDARNGSLQWQNESFDLATDEQIVADDERVYAINRTTDDEGNSVEELYALNVADGSEAWRFRPPNVSTTSNSYDEWILFKPVVSDDAVYLKQRETESGNSYERLIRINASTGDLEWRESFYEKSGVKVVDGLIYATGTGSSTHLYDAATGDYLGEHGEGLGYSGAIRTIANGTMFAWDAGEGGGLRAFVEGGVFEYTDFSVSSNHAETGESVTVMANVTNTGTLNRSYSVYLRTSPSIISLEQPRQGTLTPGQSETLTWDVSFDDRGDYVVVLGPSDDKSMDSHVYDRTGSVTISVGDDRDGQTIPLDGPRSISTEGESWPTADRDAGNTNNNSETAAPTDVGVDVDDVVVDNIRWRSAPVVVNDTIYFGGYDGSDEHVYAYNATDGSLEWSYEPYTTNIDGEVSTTPTYASGHIYVGTNTGRLYVLNATTGERLWVHTVAESFDSVNGVTVVDGVAYVAIRYGTSPTVGRIDALDATTRERLWTFETSGTDWDPMPVTPAVENGTVYISNDDGKSYALNSSTGAEEWNRSISGPSGAVHSPVVEDGVVYVDNGTALFALDAAEGTTIWNTSATVDGDSGSSPALANDTLYFVDSGVVRAVNAGDGSTRWTELICADVPTSPAVAGDVVYITTAGGTVHAFDGTTGNLTWRFDAGTKIEHSPAVVDGVLYTTSDASPYTLYALTGGTTNESVEYIQYSNLAVSATDVTVGEQITVEADVENVGEASCPYDASFYVEDDEVDNTTGSVSDGSTETVSFAHTFDSIGTYNVTVENLTSVEVTVTAAQPKIDTSEESYDFGDIDKGNYPYVDILISNVGQADLDWTDSTVTGTDAYWFVVSSYVDGAGTVLSPGDSEWVRVSLDGSEAGTRTATLEIHSNDTDSPLEIPLSANVIADPPVVQVTPTTFDFGDVTNGSSVETNVTVENVGGSTLSFDGVTLGSSDYGSFAVVDGGTTLSLDPGDSHNVTVEFAPTSENVDTATLTVNTDDPENGSVDVSLSGTGVAPEPGRVAVTPIGIDFGDVVNGTSVSTNVTIENVGEADLEFESASVGGSDFGSFSLGGDGAPATLTPGETRNVTVTFAPTSASPDSATLTIGTNDPNNSTVDVTLSGNGVPEPAPDIDVSPLGYFYESVPVDGTGSTTIVVNNTGDATLNVTDVAVTGANASEFTPTSTSFHVSPGGTFVLPVDFDPTTLGTKSAMLEISSNDTDELTVLVELGGQAIDMTPPAVAVTNVTGSNESGTTVHANDTVAVEVNATDEHSSIESVFVLLNSDDAEFIAVENATYDATLGNWTAPFESVDVPDDGNYSVQAFATDGAGNQDGAIGSETVVIDRTDPQLGASLSRVDETTAGVNLTTSEPLRSGSLAVNVSLPDGNETSVTMADTGGEWYGTFDIEEDGQYEINATGVDYAGNYGYDNATSTFQTLNTTNKTVTVVLEPSGTFIRFNTSTEINDTYVVITDSKTPLAPLTNDRAGLNFLRAQLGPKLANPNNMTNATIGVPVVESKLPRGAGKADVNLSYFNDTTKQWEDRGTEIRTVTINGRTEDYWVTEVEHFSTYGTTVTDTSAPTKDATTPSGTLAAGTTETIVRFDYSDDISGVNASSVEFKFDGSTVSGARLSVTKSYASYNAVGLSAGTYDAIVTVEDDAGNGNTFTHSFTIAASSNDDDDDDGGSSSSSPGSGNNDQTSTPTPTPEETPTTERPTATPTAIPTVTPTVTTDQPTSEHTTAPTPTATPEDGQPGFGPIAALAALLAAGLFALRRRD